MSLSVDVNSEEKSEQNNDNNNDASKVKYNKFLKYFNNNDTNNDIENTALSPNLDDEFVKSTESLFKNFESASKIINAVNNNNETKNNSNSDDNSDVIKPKIIQIPIKNGKTNNNNNNNNTMTSESMGNDDIRDNNNIDDQIINNNTKYKYKDVLKQYVDSDDNEFSVSQMSSEIRDDVSSVCSDGTNNI